MSDPAKYRTREELQKMRTERDPIDRLRHMLMDMKVMSEEDFKTLDKEIKDRVIASAEFAQNSPEPEPSELWTDVFVAA